MRVHRIVTRALYFQPFRQFFLLVWLKACSNNEDKELLSFASAAVNILDKLTDIWAKLNSSLSLEVKILNLLRNKKVWG